MDHTTAKRGGADLCGRCDQAGGHSETRALSTMAIGAMTRFDTEADSHVRHPNEGSSTLSGAGHAARGLPLRTRANLARAASVGIVPVPQFEGESGTPRPATLTVLQQALEAAGPEFIPETGGGAGIRFRDRKG